MPQIQAFAQAIDERERNEHFLLSHAFRAALQSDRHWGNYVREARMEISRRQAERSGSAEGMNPVQVGKLRMLLGGKPAKEKKGG